MGKYASTASDTSQSEEGKLWVYQSKSHFEKALKAKSNGSTVVRKANEKRGSAMYQPPFGKDGIFNFAYYNSNDELRVDDGAILRMNPNSGNYESWQGASYFFKWKGEVSDWLMLNSGFMLNRGFIQNSDDKVWLSSLTPSKSATKGFGKEFRPVKYTWEYADRNMLLWNEAMKELKTQTADRKAAEKDWAETVKKEEVSIANLMLEQEKNKMQVEEAKRKKQVERTLRALNKEAAADAKNGGKGLGKKSKATKTSQSKEAGESSNPRGNTHRREDQTTGTGQSSKGGRRGDSPKRDKDRRS